MCLVWVTRWRWRQGFWRQEHHRNKQVWEERRCEELGFYKLRRACRPSREEGAGRVSMKHIGRGFCAGGRLCEEAGGQRGRRRGAEGVG